MSSPRIATLQVAAAAVLFSTGGAAIKLSALDAWAIAGLRSAIAAVAIWVLIPACRRRWSASTWAVGAAYAGVLLLFVHANKLTTAAAAVFLQAPAPLYALLLSPLLLQERLQPRERRLLIVLPVGLLFLLLRVDPTSASAPNPLLGALLAALSGVFYALAILGLRRLSRGAEGTPVDGLAATVCGNVLVAAVSLPLAAWGPIAPRDLLVVAYLGLFQVGFAYFLMTRALRRLRGVEATLLLLLEPLLSPLWSGLLHNEPVAATTWIGGGILLTATVLYALGQGRGSSSA